MPLQSPSALGRPPMRLSVLPRFAVLSNTSRPHENGDQDHLVADRPEPRPGVATNRSLAQPLMQRQGWRLAKDWGRMDRTDSVHLVYLRTTYQDEMLRINKTDYIHNAGQHIGDEFTHIYDVALQREMNEISEISTESKNAIACCHIQA
ncbi:hypothetical protein ACQKWADRAFT_44001 [Trichoderma austrokoningii]